jgi:urease accessory protein
MISYIWLLISGSALPLGSFAFSSSLESYVVHIPIPLDSAILDNELDTSTPCNVARHASTSQGRTLMTVWDKSLSASLAAFDSEERQWVDRYKHFVRKGKASGHFGIAWGVICRASGLQLEDVCYVFMFNHCKAVLSAAVRLGLIGPYHAQAVLVLKWTREKIQTPLTEGKKISVDNLARLCLC